MVRIIFSGLDDLLYSTPEVLSVLYTHIKDVYNFHKCTTFYKNKNPVWKMIFLRKKYPVIKCKTKFSALHEFLSCTTEINFTQRTLACTGYFTKWKNGTGLCNLIYFKGIDYIYMESCYEFLKKWRDYLNEIGIFRSSKKKKYTIEKKLLYTSVVKNIKYYFTFVCQFFLFNNYADVFFSIYIFLLYFQNILKP